MASAGRHPGRRTSVPVAVAVDIGTSSVRAGVFDTEGRRLPHAWVQSPYAMEVRPSGEASVDADMLLALMGDVLDRLVVRVAPILERVVAVGISCFLHSFAPVDHRGRPIGRLLSWADTRSAASATSLRASTDAEAARHRTGCPVHASYWPARVRWASAEEQRPSAFAGFPDLLVKRLTGRRATTLSQASATGMLDRATREWDAELLDVLGIRRSALPAVLGPGDAIGRLSDDVRARWPALAGVPWFGPWSDAWCSNVGAGCVDSRSAALIVGTSGAMRSLVPEPAPTVPSGLFAFRVDEERSLVGGQLSEGGGVLRAISRLLSRSPTRLAVDAQLLEPDAHGLTVLPFLAGERSPGYHAGASGTITGLTLTTDPAAIYRATLESLAYRFAAIDELLSGVVDTAPRIVVAGGALTTSSLWTGLLADVLGRPIAVTRVPEASSRGAALLALERVRAVVTARAAPVASRTIVPDPTRSGRYLDGRRRHEALYDRLFTDAP